MGLSERKERKEKKEKVGSGRKGIVRTRKEGTQRKGCVGAKECVRGSVSI